MKTTPVISNKQALRDYHIFETIECGIELKGSEVKSLREGRGDLSDSFARIEQEEIFLYNMYIDIFEKSSFFSPEPKRPRKLLLHKSQIKRLQTQVLQKGFTLIPLKVYFNQRGIAKVELSLARGKKKYDKRETIKKRQVELDIRRRLLRRR
jgi:SsrA-binding protein